MIIGVPITVSAPPSVTVPSSELSQGASDRVSTRTTQDALAAPLADARVDDKPREQRAPANGTRQPQAAPPASQQADTVSIASNVSRFAPALQYNTLVGYGFVKFKPSDAGSPQNQPSGKPVTQAEQRQQGGQFMSEYGAYSNTQRRNLSELSPAQPQLLIAG